MTQVGRYQIQEELGRGAMGVVYKALDPATGRTVAIKAIRLADLPDPDERERVRERMFHEAQAAGILSHQNIVAVYGFLDQEEFAYIFMEYVDGASLHHMLQQGSLPLRLIEFLRQVAEALDYAHRKGIVHRDIKPANIIISNASAAPNIEALAKVADFGVARFVSPDMPQDSAIAGTPNYMSPEQIQGTTVDGRSEQFSFGAVVYELLTGAKPFTGDQLPALVYAICKQDPAPVNQVNPALSEGTGKVVQRALMKDPAQRFASCGEFVGALSIALGESAAPDSGLLEEDAEGADGPAAVAGAPLPSPVISIPEETPYELPTRVRRRREKDDLEFEQRPERSPGGKKLALILVMCCAIFATIVFIVLSNSGPTVPVQVLDSRSGSVSPPPEGMEVAKGAPHTSRQDTAAGTQTQAPQNRRPQELKATASRLPRGNPGSTAGAIGASAPATPTGSEVSDVELLTEPPGAKMVVDGRSDLTCNAPCTLSLTNGRHTVSAELDGYNIARRIFNAPNNASLFVNMGKSMGVVVVTSALSGCTVLVDGRPSGSTPATLHLTAGSHRIAVVSRASRHEETVQVQIDGFDVERFLCQ